MAKAVVTDSQTRLKISRAASDIFEEKGYEGARCRKLQTGPVLTRLWRELYYFRARIGFYVSIPPVAEEDV
ncbi:MAG: hypothetical protein IPI74_07905 [Bacteroidales bacterium]|nr:hypothetical protein [Bacteroidales bacterium]